MAATPERVTRDQLRQNASRHRYHFAPPATPPGFWDMGFMDSQVIARSSFAASCDALPELLDGLKSGPPGTSLSRMHLGTDITMRHLVCLLAFGTWASWTPRYATSNLWPALVYCVAPLTHHRLHCKFLCVPGSSFHMRCYARCSEQAVSGKHVKTEL